jgi:hypothetical protein
VGDPSAKDIGDAMRGAEDASGDLVVELAPVPE